MQINAYYGCGPLSTPRRVTDRFHRALFLRNVFARSCKTIEKYSLIFQRPYAEPIEAVANNINCGESFFFHLNRIKKKEKVYTPTVATNYQVSSLPGFPTVMARIKGGGAWWFFVFASHCAPFMVAGDPRKPDMSELDIDTVWPQHGRKAAAGNPT